ncbi:MAG: sugar phosphate isomerase/epimerase [Isosphaeraceae bacterium]|nr:sugar phosphate isomerase/epimerase [Isosphaeraceae bacterium]
MRPETFHDLTRRDLLAAGLSAVGALALGGRATAAPATPDSPYGPFKMGLQSYSLRGYTKGKQPDVDRALAVTKALGLHYWEAFPGHFPMTADADRIAAYRSLAQAEGVSVIGYGVNHFGKDHDANRRVFEFAKKFGLEYLSADPTPDSFESLDKLVDEFGIAIGIHNHGPGHRYEKIDVIADAIKNHHEKIGCCIDTGHFLRSREDPVRAAEVFGKRIYGVHLKDVKDAKQFTVLGQGDLRTAELLKTLARLKYNYCLALEYEEHPEDPEADLRECLKAVREAAATIKNG